jgi:hypothetical protein
MVSLTSPNRGKSQANLWHYSVSSNRPRELIHSHSYLLGLVQFATFGEKMKDQVPSHHQVPTQIPSKGSGEMRGPRLEQRNAEYEDALKFSMGKFLFE